MSRTIQQLAQEACDVQNACNLQAVVTGMSRALRDLDDHVRGTVALREHPIARAWADKIASLTGTQSINDIALKAHDQCLALARG